ncbi:MAG: TerC family protein [Spirochaetota bacterium]
MSTNLIFWIVFGIIVATTMIIDLGVFSKNAHEIKLKESLRWTVVWISLAFLFNAGIYYRMGAELGTQFLTGYLLEYSLSVDNLFVFLIIFSYFKVPRKYQHRVLFWGILVAIIARIAFILGGVALVTHFSWILYVFGVILVYTGIKMAFKKGDDEIDPEKNIILKIAKKFLHVTKNFHEEKFFIREKGRLVATPLFLVLIVIETSDIIFAVDSVPAILSISTNTLIVITSNIFAIMGLRSLYFALSGIMQIFHYLHYGLAFLLSFIGVKMLISKFVHIPIGVALSVVVVTLAASIVASLVWPEKKGSKKPGK